VRSRFSVSTASAPTGSMSKFTSPALGRRRCSNSPPASPAPLWCARRHLGHDLTNGGLGCPVRAFKLASAHTTRRCRAGDSGANPPDGFNGRPCRSRPSTPRRPPAADTQEEEIPDRGRRPRPWA
jgi:hypothetical protein